MDLDLKRIFGNNLKFYRFKNKLSQEALAEKVNCSSNYISEIENGKYSVSFELIGALSKVLKIQPYQLFCYNENHVNLPNKISESKQSS